MNLMAVSTPYTHIQQKIQREECVVLDGAIATELQALGARDFQLSDSDHWGFEALHHSPDTVSEVHKSYIAAGCDIVTTNTYGILDAPAARGNKPARGTEPLHWINLARESISLARSAIHEFKKDGECAVAFSIGGDVVTSDNLTTIKLLLRNFRESPPDLVLFETLSLMQDDYTREAISLVLEADIPVWLSFRRCRDGVCGIHGQLWGGPEGDYFGRLAAELEQLGVAAILINCLPPYRVSGTLPWLADFTDLPLGAYPNLGRYIDPEWRLDEDTFPEDYADMALMWRAEGAKILGGCCGVRPAHIEAMAKALQGTSPRKPIGQMARKPERKQAVADSPAIVDPWVDFEGREIFPLPLPKIHCDPGVFVPTQGSYLAWKYLLNHKIGKDQHCLDIGCGAGLLSIQLALNGATEVTAMDVQEEAVANTLTNAFRNGVADRVIGKTADLYTLKPRDKIDIIVASLYQMPTDPKGEISGHRPVDYWGRNILDHCITMLPKLLKDDGTAYIMQISLVGQQETERLLREVGFRSRIVDYSLYQFSPVFLENMVQIERVEQESDAYHFTFRDSHVMVMYLIEARRA